MSKSDGFPKYYDSSGSPGRIRSDRHLPEIYVGRGKWNPWDREDLIANSTPISEAEAKALIARLDRAPRRK
jgi:hypothetical protein